MTTTKIAVSLPSELVDGAREAVQRGASASVSAYVAAALAEKSKLDALERMLEEMLEESGGPLSKAEERHADEALGRRPSRTRAR